jgi:hypothetical protein
MNNDHSNQALKPLLPTDVRPRWFNPIRRLQSVARAQGGAAVLTISVVVDADGNPKFWTAPRVCLIEPKMGDQEFYEFLRSLTV